MKAVLWISLRWDCHINLYASVTGFYIPVSKSDQFFLQDDKMLD
jgi:hypothetical protein